ncbi:MAG TPA: GIY-YIG nuclease family protein, partial [Cyclobacteriaceae bacterium]|nr:GIY-YIG nuclease family protein [Cyclobacteriaceae bacterium]
ASALQAEGRGFEPLSSHQTPDSRGFAFMDALVYILHSAAAGKYYIGHTTEPIEERLRKHNSDHDGFTGKYSDWRVVFTEKLTSKALAYAREREIKRRKSRKMIEALIARSE